MQMLTHMTFTENSQKQLFHQKNMRFSSEVVLLFKCPVTITKFSDSVHYATFSTGELPWSHESCKAAKGVSTSAGLQRKPKCCLHP